LEKPETFFRVGEREGRKEGTMDGWKEHMDRGPGQMPGMGGRTGLMEIWDEPDRRKDEEPIGDEFFFLFFLIILFIYLFG
jgi:hypothetical protein